MSLKMNDNEKIDCLFIGICLIYFLLWYILLTNI